MAKPTTENLTVHGSVHDEVYLALKPLIKLMRIHGLFPIQTNSRGQVDPSEVNNLSFRWRSKLWVLSMVAFFGVVYSSFLIAKDYFLHMVDPLESLILSAILSILCFSSVVNLFKMVFQGPQWPSYFRQWQRLDRALNKTMDKKLRFHVKALTVAYVIFAGSAVGSAMRSAINKYLSPNKGDYTGDGFIIGWICFSVFINGCLLLPELLFICFSVAIKSRIVSLTEKIQSVSLNENGRLNRSFEDAKTTDAKLDVSHELEGTRIAYEYLLDIISSTNSMMGPIFNSCVSVTFAYLSSTIYMLFFQSLDNKELAFSKIVFSSVCVLRLMAICFSADQIKRKVADFKRNLYLVSPVQLKFSQESYDELMLFIKCIRKSTVSFTAIGFYVIDKELFNKIVGATLTYTITILEFSQKNEHPWKCDV